MNFGATLKSSTLSVVSAVSIAWVLTLCALTPDRSLGDAAKPDAKTNYVNYCALCHGDSGEGAKGPPLLHMKMDDKTAAQVTADGDSKAMPGFGDQLSHDQITALIKYIRTFVAKK